MPTPKERAVGSANVATEAELAELLQFQNDSDGSEDWRQRALCAQTDPEAFFPEKGGSHRRAKRVCEGCEVANDCLDFALENNVLGIWGGMTEHERRDLKRRAS